MPGWDFDAWDTDPWDGPSPGIVCGLVAHTSAALLATPRSQVTVDTTTGTAAIVSPHGEAVLT